MFAVVFRATIHDAQQASHILPLMKAMPGFDSGEVIVLQDGEGLLIARFESVDAAQSMIDQWNRTPPAEGVLTVDDVGFGEVVQHT
jgi:hypothetical protein